ncbi:MAG: type IV pilus secretin PilQ, partial [Elusimicrobiaceae bacterium]
MKKIISVIMAFVFQVAPVLPAFAENEKPSMVEKVTISKDAVLIKGNSELKYDAFSTKEPPCVVVEILNSEVAGGLAGDIAALDGELVRSVRVEQYQQAPVKISRVTIILKENADYTAVAKNNAVAVFLQKAPEEKSIPKVVYEEPKTAVYMDILSNLPKEKIKLDYDSADVRQVLGAMADKIGVNMIFADDVAGDVTMRLNNVPFDEAFNTILSVNGLVAQQMGSNIIRVATAQAVKSETASAQLVTRAFRLKYLKAEEAKTLIIEIVNAEGRKGKVSVNADYNMVLVTDIPSGLDSIERLLSQIDKKPVQILIETKIVEVNLTDNFQFGVEWNAYGADNSTIGGSNGLNFFGSGNVANQALTGVQVNGVKSPYKNGDDNFTPLNNTTDNGGTGVNWPSVANEIASGGSFRFGRIASNLFLDVTINAAALKGKAKVLSDPKVATLNNKTANINITTQIPYTTTETTNSNPPISNTVVHYIDTGITLEVTPIVNEDNRIMMKVKPKVSQKSATITPTSGGAPGVDTRGVETNIMTRDGETIVIGGLIYDENSDSLYKVPILGDIPILGWLFKKKVEARQRIELLIF